jgi:hypothetical protein
VSGELIFIRQLKTENTELKIKLKLKINKSAAIHALPIELLSGYSNLAGQRSL